jgi:aryl-alcohol dehydrogenase-like predicted oxidoreductase
VDYRTLGRSGCAVSALALGTMTFGAETDEAGAHEQLDVFVEAGGTLVGRADVYSAGAAEEIVGRWLASHPAGVRDRVVFATKGRFPMGEEPNALGNSRRHLAVPVILEPSYGLLVRDVEFEIVPACLHNGLGMLPWGPLGGGWLSGKYTRDQRPEGATRLGEDPGRGMEAYDRVGSQQRTWDVLEVVQDVAEARGVSMPQVALAWLAARPAVSSVILGASTTGQLRDDLASST